MKEKTLTPILRKEAQLLFYASTKQTCPEELCSYYHDWVCAHRDAMPLVFPKLIVKVPWLMALLEPLPGQYPEFDARRVAMLTLAESHPTSAPLFYAYRPTHGCLFLMRLGLIGVAELCKLPVRLTLSRWLWA